MKSETSGILMMCLERIFRVEGLQRSIYYGSKAVVVSTYEKLFQQNYSLFSKYLKDIENNKEN